MAIKNYSEAEKRLLGKLARARQKEVPEQYNLKVVTEEVPSFGTRITEVVASANFGEEQTRKIRITGMNRSDAVTDEFLTEVLDLLSGC